MKYRRKNNNCLNRKRRLRNPDGNTRINIVPWGICQKLANCITARKGSDRIASNQHRKVVGSLGNLAWYFGKKCQSECRNQNAGKPGCLSKVLQRFNHAPHHTASDRPPPSYVNLVLPIFDPFEGWKFISFLLFFLKCFHFI